MAYPENTINDNGIKHIWDKITAAFENKVDKVSGKVLSTNDYTNEEKALVATIPDKADSANVTEVDTSNTTPFLYRQTPHNADGVFLDKLVGGSVAWNQLIKNISADAWTVYSSADSELTFNNGVATLTAKAARSSGLYNYGIKTYLSSISVIQNHKYYVAYDIKPTFTAKFGNEIFENYIEPGYSKECPANQWTHVEYERIAPNNRNSSALLYFSDPAGGSVAIGDSYQLKNFMCVDLTVMFGAAIADYAYSLGSANAIAFYKSHGFFTKDYYPYNTGELISVKTSGKKYVGFNQWDEEWELGTIDSDTGENVPSQYMFRSKNFIPCLPNTAYYIKASNLARAFYYDINKGIISYVINPNNTIITTPSNCHFMRIRSLDNNTIYNYDICINISKTEGTPKNGDYVPYEEHTYDISNIDLRGIPKLVNNELVYDGDTYDSNGDVNRKYGIVDLGSLSWSYSSGSSVFYANMPSDSASITNTGLSNCLCENGYVIYSHTRGDLSNMPDKSCLVNSSILADIKRIAIKDLSKGTDAATFKTAMSGVYLIYELATTTTETTDPYTNPQICGKDGTEEFIDNRDVPIPVGHNSRYADLPAIMDGDYLGYMAKNFASEEYVDRQVEGEFEQHLEMPWVKVIDNDTTIEFDDIPIEGPVEYAYVLADNEFFKHRFILLEVYEVPGGLIRSFVRASALLSIDTLLEFSGSSYGEMISFPKSGDTVEVFVGIVDDDGTYKFTISLESTGSTIYNDFRARARYID